MNRREFLAAGLAVLGTTMTTHDLDATTRQPAFRISLAEWSLHRAIRSGVLEHLDFPRTAKKDFGIEGVEYVSTLFRSHDDAYLRQLQRRAGDAGVQSLLIMVDAEGRLGDPDPALRAKAVANHVTWLDAASRLGCRSIRVNAESEGTRDEQQKLVADGLRALCREAEGCGLNVLIENHGGLSSDATWLEGVMRLTDHPRAGLLPDFGNFYENEMPSAPDRYEGVRMMMRWAKAVSAKSRAFDAAGNETASDFRRMMKIVLESGYHGWVGVEYEGDALSETAGIRATKALLERIRGS